MVAIKEAMTVEEEREGEWVREGGRKGVGSVHQQRGYVSGGGERRGGMDGGRERWPLRRPW